MDEDFYTVADVARLLKISTETVRRLIEKGKIRAERPSERIIRIPVLAFEEYKRSIQINGKSDA